jgi:alpha/beta superfamily hydrolase
VLVGPAVSRAEGLSAPPESLVIHGERDETVLLADVLDWARPLGVPIVVVPEADHFFHRRLTLLKRLVEEALLTVAHGRAAGSGGAP